MGRGAGMYRAAANRKAPWMVFFSVFSDWAARRPFFEEKA